MILRYCHLLQEPGRPAILPDVSGQLPEDLFHPDCPDKGSDLAIIHRCIPARCPAVCVGKQSFLFQGNGGVPTLFNQWGIHANK